MYSRTIEFIRSLYQTSDFIPLHEPKFVGNEKKYVLDTIDSTFVSSVGKYVDQFEIQFANFVGSKFAVATVNGTSALHVALKLVGVSSGDEVITQPLTFVATCNAIRYCGADPIFLDIDASTLGLSAASVERFLNKNAVVENNQCINKKTRKCIRACVPMHTFGHPVEIKKLKKLCEDYSIRLVEDAAESLGSYYEGQHTATFAEIGVFSFNGNKIITTGGGGMIVTDNAILAKHAKHLTTTAKIPHQWDFVHDELGYNYRMPNINAALGLAQLESLPEYITRKRYVADEYKKHFSQYEDIQFISEPAYSKSNYWLNTLLMKNEDQRNQFLHEMNQAGVMVRPAWRSMSELELFNSCASDDLSFMNVVAKRLVNIPSSVIL